MLGLSIKLGGQSWSVSDFKGAWGIDRGSHCQWSENDRLRQLGEACMFVRDLLRKAKVKAVMELHGVPIEASFEDNRLISWRVLEEVLQTHAA